MLKNAGPQDQEVCGELGYKCSAILKVPKNSQKFELTFQLPRLGPVYTRPGKFFKGTNFVPGPSVYMDTRICANRGFFLHLCCDWLS